MPILEREADIYPPTLLDDLSAESNSESPQGDDDRSRWWALYTLSRREKQLMRQLRELEIPFYSPLIPKRYRSPNGRVRESYIPLFSNYVFLYGNNVQRYEAVSTGTVSRYLEVLNDRQFTEEMNQVKQLIMLGRPLTPEAKLEEGDPIRVKSGVFRGFEGYVIRRQHKTRLLIWVHLLNQGVSAEMDEAVLEPRV